jgi:uncharacterized protein YdhG (YjbR/CyaY superfamily)
MNKPQTVDAYIEQAPADVQEKLRELRRLLKGLVPEATERISYGMPSYHATGPIAYFAPARNHLGLYLPPPVIEEHAADLAGYVTTKSAIHLALNTPLPVPLIQKLVKARMKINRSKQR